MTIDIYTFDNFELLYSELPLGAAVFSKKGSVIYVNKFLLAMTGYSETTFKKMDITSFTGLGLMEFKTEYSINLPHSQGGYFPATCTYIPLNEDYYALFAEKIIDISKLNINNLTDLDKYKMFLDLTDSIILLIDSHGRVRYINKTGCDIIGYKKEFILGKEWIKHFVPKEYADYVTKCLKDAMSQQGPIELHSQNPVLTISGETRIIKWKDIKIFDEHNKISSTLSSGTDVTEQVKNEIRFNFSDEIAQMGNWSKNLITDEYVFSDGFYRLMGYKPGEVNLSLPFIFKAVHPDDSEITQKTILESYRTNIGYNFIFRIIRTDGEIRYIKAASLFQKDTSGTPIMSFGTVIDITEMMESRIELTEARDSLMLAEEIANIGSYIRDMETNLYICSNGFFKILGLKKYRNPMEYWEVISFTHPEDLELVKNNIESSIIDSDTFDFENRIIRADGELRFIRSRGTHIRGADGKITKILGTLLDITDYKMNEERLINNIKKIEQAEHITSMGFWEYNLQTCEYSCSEGFCKVCGLDPKTFVPSYDSISSTVHIDDREFINNTFASLDKTGDSFSFEHRIITPDNQIKFIKSRGVYLKDAFGALQKRIGTIIDITDYVEATEKSKENEKRLEDAELLAGIGHWEWNLETDEHYMSKGLLNIFGYKSILDIPAGGNIKNIYHKKDSGRVAKLIQDAIDNEKDDYYYEAMIVRPGGEIRNVAVSGILLKNQNGEVIKTKGTYSDITRIKEYQHKIRENEIRMRSAEEAANIGSWERDLRTGVYICSPGVFKIRGESNDTGHSTFDEQISIVHPDDRNNVIETIENALREGKNYELHHRIIKPDGSICYISVKATLLKDSEGVPIKVYGTILDETSEKKRLEERLLIESHLRNQQKLESIGILAGGVAHEINNPINGIMNYSQLILDETKGDSDIRTYASEIIKETERVAVIVRNLLKFSRKDQSYYSTQSIQEIIENTTSLINTILKKDQITLNINIPATLPVIKCNGQQIQQVIMNLITNARDSLNEKYPAFNKNKTISISGTSVERNSGRFVQLKIEDSGTGIPENVRDNVFDPFFTTKQPGQGTGLGLSISYRIIEEHGGNLYFASKTGEFTRFFVELPIEPIKD